MGKLDAQHAVIPKQLTLISYLVQNHCCVVFLKGMCIASLQLVRICVPKYTVLRANHMLSENTQ